MEVVVTGIGLVSALGECLEVSWHQLISGKSGIQLYQPFAELKQRPLALIGKQPAELRTLVQLVVASALKDAALVPSIPNCGVVIGSSRAHQASWEQLAQQMYLTVPTQSHSAVEPNLEHWLDTLPHMNANRSCASSRCRSSSSANGSLCNWNLGDRSGYHLLKQGNVSG
jgi:3-oxoacyl-[acyl-carrier-protein] synthase II